MIHILYHIVISGWYGGESEYGDRLFVCTALLCPFCIGTSISGRVASSPSKTGISETYTESNPSACASTMEENRNMAIGYLVMQARTAHDAPEARAFAAPALAVPRFL